MFLDILLLPETSDVPTMGRPAVWQGLSPCPARFSEMRNSSSTSSSQNHMSRVEAQYSGKGENFVLGLWGVRYQVEDVVRSVAFYTERVGFKLDQQNLPAFARVSVGHLKLILSGPGTSGSRPMPDGRKQEPEGGTG